MKVKYPAPRGAPAGGIMARHPRITSYPTYSLPNNRGLVVQGQLRTLYNLADITDHAKSADLIYMNVCSYSGFYKLVGTSVANSGDMQSYMSYDLLRRNAVTFGVNKFLIIAPERFMFSMSNRLERSHNGDILPFAMRPISDDTSDPIHIVYACPEKRVLDNGNSIPQYPIKKQVLKPYYHAERAVYHGSNDYKIRSARLELWIEAIKDFLIATTDKGDLVFSVTGDAAVLGIACLETGRRLFCIEQDIQQFELDKRILKQYGA